MTAKEFLKQYKKLDKEIAYLEQQIEWAELEADTIRSTSDNDGMPHGSNIGHPTEDKAIRLSDAKRRWKELRTEKVMIRLSIVDVINKLPYPQNFIIHYRYLDEREWKWISRKIELHKTQTHEHHKRALTTIQNYLEKNQ